MSTGVIADDTVSSAFNDFKVKAGEYGKCRYFIYVLTKDQKSIVIEKTGDRSKTYDDFVEELPEHECRYGLIDVEFESSDGRETSKMVFISWVPDTSKIREKMVYSGSKEAIKTALNGCGIHINATDQSELDFETSILPVLKKYA
mmetsp:Transcript_26103/g.38638  ORF Transcript_26103/g.38638 Transcript_26103/m.38638 type:complete len:145 (-) Transcript_26103:308-742(-)|eukprot:CAMPEP_0195530296 /NCGR_PEP_ID=MMETSP0794_2-20130614/33138_1 /TAXON_ID=515487 /ORGANISM="Stephanopyxis turris, Strain CCMP 815" /LENGTH=144 /DNA_ID=CAMNT_0040661775 /DNA_START=171 /DNA_END=605 /DNA_ORIENTATION=-